MYTKTKKMKQCRAGFTLVECMLASLVLIVVVIGLMSFRYYTVLNAEAAENQLLAARAASLLAEAWRGQEGDLSFDPMQQDFDADFVITSANASNTQWYMGLAPYGTYAVTLDGKQFQAQLFQGNMWGLSTLRSIYVIIQWTDHRGVEHEYHLPALSGITA